MVIQPTSASTAARRAAQPTLTTSEPDTVSWTFEYDATGLPPLTNVGLKGSFNPATGLFDPNWKDAQVIPMTKDDQVYTCTVQLKNGQPEDFHWGVVGSAADGSFANKPLIMTEEPPAFNLSQPEHESYYAPVTNHVLGLHRQGADGVRWASWSPALGRDELADYHLSVDLYGQDGRLEQSLPMHLKDGNWELQLDSGWSQLQGKSYQYSARNSRGELLKTHDGTPVTYADPTSRYLQGPQRGLERIFVDPVLGFETGWYDDSSKGGPNYADNPQWGRFSVDGHANADQVKLILKDDQGHQLTRAELLERLGQPAFVPYDQARPEDRRDVDVLKSWQLEKTPPITPYIWTNTVNDDGAIDLKKVTSSKAGTAWTINVNNFPRLVGLHYEFQVVENGKLVGDKNGDGQLSNAERIATPFNDPYSNTVAPKPGSARRSLIRESTFQPQFQNAPRMEKDPKRFVIYEAHVGSFMGSKDNAVAATFQDMIDNLGYLQQLGANTIELMPTNECCAKREWGYTPDHYFAGAEAYGFEMPRAEALQRGLIGPDEAAGQDAVWINGTDALHLFIDEAHKRGFNVMADVVYNHTSGRADGDNPLAMVDGDRKSYFKWNGAAESYSPWGAKPNYGAQGVKNFLTDNAVEQVTEHGFDGIRFDFVQVLHNTGTAQEQVEGMNALRQINRTLALVKPNTYTVAEDFTGNWLVAADLDKAENQWGVDKKGMGFSAVWNDAYKVDVFGVAEGSRSMDELMGAMTNHVGVTGFDRAVMYAVSHDEVGNSGKWIGRGAAHSKADAQVMQSYPRSVARSVAALTLTGPGVPMIWQGEEFMANNDFKHGLTATWGFDTDWLSFPVTPDKLARFQAGDAAGLPDLFARYQKMSPEEKASAVTMAERVGQFKAYQDLVHLRTSHPDAFSATAPIQRVFTHNADRVMAYARGNDDFVVVTNFSGQDRQGYNVNLPAGHWKEVFNSNAAVYGGSNTGNGGAVIDGGSGMTLPAGSTIVLQKV